MMDITLEGVAGKRFGRSHKLAVNNPKEAIRALCQLLPGFREFLTSAHELGIFFQIITTHSSNNSYEELGLGCSSFSLVPVITGAMSLFKNIGLILVGVLLVAISFGAFGIAYGAVGTVSAGLQMAAMSLGFALIFTGIAGLFAPGAPEDGKQEGAEADDAVFQGTKSTSKSGAVIPLLYGEFLVTNMPVISSYVEGEDGYLLHLISEGEIEGLANNDKSRDLYFNGLQLRATEINDRDIEITDGGPGQLANTIKSVESAGFHLPVGATLDKAPSSSIPTTVIRSFNQPSADTLKLRFLRGPTYMLLQKSPKSGGKPETTYKAYNSDNVKGDADKPDEAEDILKWKYEVINGDGRVIKQDTIFDDGPLKSLQLYKEKGELPSIDISGEPVPISIKVYRFDHEDIPDPVAGKGGATIYSHQWTKGDVQWVSADVTWSEKLVYPHTALLACKFKAGEFNQMPTVQGLFKGLKVKRVHHDLSISTGWTDNPAYILLDLLTNPRYGCGGREYKTKRHNETVVVPGITIDDLDLASFRVAALYCNKHNIKFNAYINSGADALDLIRSVASSFQGSLIYYGGKVTVIIDKRVEGPEYTQYRLFTEANVIQETDDSGQVTEPCFTYEGTAKKARTTSVEVSYIEPDLFYQEQKETVEDIKAIERYGFNQKRVRAIGCTTRKQARRFGKYVLASNLLNTETVSFKVGSEGAVLLPGDVCVIADPLKTQVLSGGRIKSATTHTVTIDREPTLPSGTWFLYCYSSTGIAQRAWVNSIQGNVISTRGFRWTPTSSHVWLLVDEQQEKYFRRYRVQNVKDNADGTYDVVAISYTNRKFDYVNSDDDIDFGVSYNTFKNKRVKAVNPSQINFSIRNS